MSKVILIENNSNPPLSNLEKEKLPHRKEFFKRERLKKMVCQ